MERIDILYKSKVIDDSVYTLTNNVIAYLKDKYQLNEENIEILITHFAMASQRIRKGDIADAMDEAIFNQIKAKNTFLTAKKVMDELSLLSDINYPKSEAQYILLHLTNTLKGR